MAIERITDFALRPLCVSRDLVAHTPGATGRWHSLGEHSRSVGYLAAEFAEPFGGSQIARLAGYLHDAGKATDEVQGRLRAAGADLQQQRRPLGAPHKVEGAIIAAGLLHRRDPRLALSAYLQLFGHHSGMPAWKAGPSMNALRIAVDDLAALEPLTDLMSNLVGADLTPVAETTQLPGHIRQRATPGDPTALELFTRLCHSALVDADFLDTAAHFRGSDAPWHARTFGMRRLRDTFMSSYAALYGNEPTTEINRLRRGVFDACVKAAHERRPSGIYRLPAQTGTGKTMASAAFALNHAVRFGKRRVIVAVPFTTITTQNATAYRSILGALKGAVLEHHSNIVDEQVADDTWRRLSAPQWDGEFIVTTTVQLFESLFSNRPAQTRKLHRIVDSVIVLDEIQSLPLELLAPILAMLRELAENYGVTVLLASATQPSFWELPVWRGIPAYDILPVDHVPEVTQRVTFDARPMKQDWESVAAEVAALPQVLVVVNTRRNADALFGHIRERVTDGSAVYLLTRALTSDHRQRVLDDVRARLGAGDPVRLISTQLIEAGVDVDFPVAYRSVAPADSVVQAAGRCNREGRLGVRGGRVVVFDPLEPDSPGGLYAALADQTRNMFVAERPDRRAFDSPGDLAEYYVDAYARTTQIDEGHRRFTRLRRDLDFPETSRAFRMIPEDSSVDVVVLDHPDPTVRGHLADAITELARSPLTALDGGMRRLLGRHTASVPRSHLVGLTDELPQGVRVWRGAYDRRRGALLEAGLTW